jgi:hypothetical protein
MWNEQQPLADLILYFSTKRWMPSTVKCQS